MLVNSSLKLVRESSERIVSSAISSSNFGTASHRVRSSSMRTWGTRSGRIERFCPNFTQAGPSETRESLKWVAVWESMDVVVFAFVFVFTWELIARRIG